jgi:hypothetical protein
VSLLKKYYRDDKGLHLWQEDPRPPPKYETWDGLVGKVSAILDSRQVYKQGKQYKCLLHGYLPYEYEWINAVNMPHFKALIKEFEERRQKEAKAAAEAKADGKTQKSSKVKVPTLMKDNDIVLEDK